MCGAGAANASGDQEDGLKLVATGDEGRGDGSRRGVQFLPVYANL